MQTKLSFLFGGITQAVAWKRLLARGRIGVRYHIVLSRETCMTHAVRFVAAVAVLTALALCVPVQAQTPEINALWARAETGDAEAREKAVRNRDRAANLLTSDDLSEAQRLAREWDAALPR